MSPYYWPVAPKGLNSSAMKEFGNNQTLQIKTSFWDRQNCKRRRFRRLDIGSVDWIRSWAGNRQISGREVNASCRRTLSTNLGPPAGAGEGAGATAAGSAAAAARADWRSASAPYYRHLTRSCTDTWQERLG